MPNMPNEPRAGPTVLVQSCRRGLPHIEYTGLFFAILISSKAGKMRADPQSLASSAVLILCLNMGRTYTFHYRRKSQARLEMVGLSCQRTVLVRSSLDS